MYHRRELHDLLRLGGDGVNILEARRRLLDGEIKKRTAEGENISVRSVSRMRPGLTLYGKSEQETTTGAQLFDANTILENTWIDSDNGSETVVKGFWTSDYIMIKNGLYFCSQKGSSRTAFYNSEKEFIRYLGFKGGQIEVLEGEAYIRITGTNEYAPQTIMFNEGITALPWEPYTGGAPSPSPDYPQEIKSVGDSGTINVTLSDGGSQSQTLPVQTPNGLPGIPVSSDGNYTDADGQQWVCDEVDFKRGVYVQRVGKYIPTGNESISGPSTRDGVDEYVFGCETGAFKNSTNFGLSNKFKYENIFVSNTFTVTDKYIYFRFAEDTQTPESAREVLNGCEFWYILATSIETPLSASELAAYAALRTYSPTTVVSNNAGAWMKLGYKTKKSLEVTD